MYTCFDIADYFLSKAEDDEELLSNLKLQKLMYYAQGLYLITNGQPLFSENIEAWTYGPVVPDLYHKHKNYGAGGIPAPTDFDHNKINRQDCEFLNEIYEVFGQYSALRLKELSHSDICWKNAYDKGAKTIISHDEMIKHMKKYLVYA
ncbi:MAG: SocA family protein [Nitrospirae bacterium]|nr:SocA family protein [Nitrospirota bacterium]